MEYPNGLLFDEKTQRELKAQFFCADSDPEFGRRNGKDLKTCDLLGAFMEARISRRYGVSSSSLRQGEEGIREKLLARHNGIDTARIIDGLDSLNI